MKFTRIISVVFLPIFIFSFTQCCTTKNEIKQEEKTVLNKDQFAPTPQPYGSAKVSCTVLNVFEKEGKNYITARIDTVHGYGVGAKPIGTGSEFDIEINKNLSNESENSFNELYKLNSRHKLLISIFENKFGNSDLKSYRIISREK